MSSNKPIGCWSMTIRCNHAPLPSVDAMKTLLESFPIVLKWCFQLEKGEQTDKLHYQMRVMVEPKQYAATMLQIFSCRFPLVRDDIDVRVESNKSVEQGALAFYVMKDETKVEGPFMDANFKMPKRPVPYEGTDLAVMASPFHFQAKILADVKRCADDRTIIWIYNKLGCSGKSKMLKFMRFKDYDMARIPMGTATQMKTNVISQGAKKIYMVDLPRVRGQDERINEIFSTLEEIKNGWVVGAMYGKVDELLMEPPHVYIFSNEVPNMKIASPDRWKIYNLYNQGEDIRMNEMTTEDVSICYAEQMEEMHPNKRKRTDDGPSWAEVIAN